MHLTRFHVTNFRSVLDSGWIEADRVTALIGVNESGKTNLLLPLWKLNPAREGDLQPTSDYPKKMFGEIREKPGAYCFIKAEFDADEMAEALAEMAGLPKDRLTKIHFPDFSMETIGSNFPTQCPPSLSAPTKLLQLSPMPFRTSDICKR